MVDGIRSKVIFVPKQCYRQSNSRLKRSLCFGVYTSEAILLEVREKVLSSFHKRHPSAIFITNYEGESSKKCTHNFQTEEKFSKMLFHQSASEMGSRVKLVVISIEAI